MATEAVCKIDGEKYESIKYANSSSVSAGEVTTVSGLNKAIIAHDSYDADATGLYYTRGIFRVSLDSGESVSQGDMVVWDVSENAAINSTSTSRITTDILLGMAVADGTASGGYVDVAINEVSEPGYIVAVGAGTTTATSGYTQNVAVTGLTSNDIPCVTIRNNGSDNRTLEEQVCCAGGMTLTFSSAPGTDLTYNYMVMRVTA